MGIMMNLAWAMKSGKQNYHNLRYWSNVKKLAKTEGLDVQYMLEALRK